MNNFRSTIMILYRSLSIFLKQQHIIWKYILHKAWLDVLSDTVSKKRGPRNRNDAICTSRNSASCTSQKDLKYFAIYSNLIMYSILNDVNYAVNCSCYLWTMDNKPKLCQVRGSNTVKPSFQGTSSALHIETWIWNTATRRHLNNKWKNHSKHWICILLFLNWTRSESY